MYRSIAKKAVVNNKLKNVLPPKVTLVKSLVMNPIIANTNVIISTTDRLPLCKIERFVVAFSELLA